MKVVSIFLSLLLFAACSKTDQNNSDSQAESEKEESSVTSINNNDFSFKCKESVKSNIQAEPSVDVLIESEKLSESLLIATEPGCIEIRNRSVYNIPNDAAFAASGYYAGGGNYYYGLVQDRTLMIYRQYIPETHPDNNVQPATTQYYLFKTIKIMSDSTAKVKTIETQR